MLPRGQGKTSLVAALALMELVTRPGAAVYCAAASREQARILFEAADRYARALDDEHVVHRHLELRWCDDPEQPKVFSRHLRVLAADAPRLHGLTPTLAVIDELHAHRDEPDPSGHALPCHRPDARGLPTRPERRERRRRLADGAGLRGSDLQRTRGVACPGARPAAQGTRGVGWPAG